MEGEVSAMETLEALWTAITTVVTKLVELLGTMSTALLSNEIFQIVMGVVMFGIGMSLVFTLVKKVKRRGK